MRRSVALPTVALAIAAIGGWSLSMGLALAGRIPLGLGVALDALAAYAAWTALHEASHGNIARGPRGRWLESAIGWATCAMFYAPFPSWRLLHLAHHAHTNEPVKDPDHWVQGRGALSIALRCLTILPRYYALFTRIETRQPLRMTVGPQIVFAAILGLAAWESRLLALLALWPLAAVIASTPLAFFFDWVPHRGGTIRNVDVPGYSILTLGHAHHAVHHQDPSVPFYRYSVLRYSSTASRSSSESESPNVWPLFE